MLPTFSYHFSLKPADVWALSNDEVEVYLKAAEELSRGE